MIALRAQASGSPYNSPSRCWACAYVVVAPAQQCFADWCEDPRLITAEVIFEDQVESIPRLPFVLVVPKRAVPTAAILHLFGGQDPIPGPLSLAWAET
jgi:hypothetical protein